ncbi:MAG: ATPase AAA [Blastomonas sp. CACIA14H2]|uniref:PDZ domain-containing protein n=1 Tax=Blastomonas sp. CACIA14H2 TaxID=1419876 RepID=UPI0003D042A4|nr:MAG: ATPase AAA [Blastomonas sp. CACIA14H2]
MFKSVTRACARTSLLSGAALAAVALGVPMASVALAPTAAAQAAKLPKPYVSRAIDATLMELTPAVRSQFGIKPRVNGVLVISTDPKGIAAKNKIVPGDIITDVRGKRVLKPIDVDTHVLYFLKKGDSAFQFGGNRNNARFSTAAEITLALFDAVIDLATVGSWVAYSTPSFSYATYYEEYSSVIVEEYSYSETIIEETITSESYVSEITSEESSYEETSESYEESSEEVTEESSEESSEETSEESSEEESAEDSEDSEEEADEADDADEAEDEADEGEDEADEADEPEEEEADEPEDEPEEDDSGGDEEPEL